MNKKEIKMSVSGGTATFRKFLSEKNASTFFDVNSSVALYAEKGFELSTSTEMDVAYKPLLGLLDKVASLSMLKNVGKAVVAVTSLSAGLASSDGDGVSWIPWIGNINAFKQTDPIKLALTFKFHMGEFGLWDAKEEVFKPLMNLMSLFIPRNISGINIVPHLQTGVQTLYKFLTELDGSGVVKSALEDSKGVLSSLGGLAAGGLSGDGFSTDGVDTALDKLFANISTNMGAVIVNTIEDAEGSFYSVDIGYGDGSFLLRRMQPENCELSFTNKEYDDNGFPIEGQITMHFKSHQPATLAGISKNRIDFGFIKGAN